MKKWYIVCCMLILLLRPSPSNAQDAIGLIIRQAIARVIRAVDLEVQKIQTKTVWLQNAQKVLENTMSRLKLGEIQDWAQKQKDLYQKYFEELWKVKDILAYYDKVRQIMAQQLQVVREYQRGLAATRSDGHFSPEEILYIGQVYTGMIEQSLKNLDQVALVIHSFTTQMSDAARMKIIDATAEGMQQNLNDLRLFNTENAQLSLSRSRDAGEISVVKALYGIE